MRLPRAMAAMFLVDLAIVASFVFFGRETHNESLDLGRAFRTATPFLIGLGAGWLPRRVRRFPMQVISGLIVGAVIVVVGLTLRRGIFGEGISGAFPLVAAGYIIGLVVLARLITSRIGVASGDGRSGSAR